MARDKLNQIIEMQQDYQRQLGHDFEKMTLCKRIAYILEMSYALEDEVHESTKEVGWKSWARSKHINEEAYRSELIDCFFFLLNLMLAARMTPLDIFRGYKAKLAKNLARIRDRYDGKSTKCPVCKREYTDAGVECSPGVHVLQPGETTTPRKRALRAA